LLNSLDPSIVGEKTYREVVHRGIKDLVKRNRREEARVWAIRAKGQGWLDESKIPQLDLPNKVELNKVEATDQQSMEQYF